MTTRDLEAFGSFVLHLHRANPHLHTIRDALRFRRIARALSRIGTAECNRELTKREVRSRMLLQNEARALGRNYLCEAVECQNDPRGAAIRLYWSGPSTYYAYKDGHGTGYAVPE